MKKTKINNYRIRQKKVVLGNLSNENGVITIDTDKKPLSALSGVNSLI